MCNSFTDDTTLNNNNDALNQGMKLSNRAVLFSLSLSHLRTTEATCIWQETSLTLEIEKTGLRTKTATHHYNLGT